MSIVGTEVSIGSSGGVGTNGASVLLPIAQLLSCTTTAGSNVLTSSALFGTIGPGWAIVGTGIPASTRVGQINNTSNLLMIIEQAYMTPSYATASGTVTLSFNSVEQRVLNDPYPCVIYNTSASGTLYLGGKTVTSSGSTIGFPLAAGNSLGIDLAVQDVLWAIASTGTINVGVLIGRQ